MQPPFTARIQQPINRQHLHDRFPIRAFPAGRQALTPERVQLQLLPQATRDPTGAPLPRPLQREFRQPHLHRGGDVRRHLPLQGKERQLRERLAIGVKDRDGFDPGGLLAVVDFAQIQNRSLHPVAVRAADLFDDAPVAMVLAVFEAVMRLEKGLAHFDAGQFTSAPRWVGRG